MTIIVNSDTFRAYHIPCEIQSVTIIVSLTAGVIMVVVTMVSVIEVVVVVGKITVWVAAIIDLVVVVKVLCVDMLVDEEFNVVATTVIVLKFASTVSYFIDMPSGLVVALCIDASAGVVVGALAGIGIKVLSDVSANSFAVVMTALRFPVSTPLEELSCCAAFDCRPLALLD